MPSPSLLRTGGGTPRLILCKMRPSSRAHQGPLSSAGSSECVPGLFLWPSECWLTRSPCCVLQPCLLTNFLKQVEGEIPIFAPGFQLIILVFGVLGSFMATVATAVNFILVRNLNSSHMQGEKSENSKTCECGNNRKTRLHRSDTRCHRTILTQCHSTHRKWNSTARTEPPLL